MMVTKYIRDVSQRQNPDIWVQKIHGFNYGSVYLSGHFEGYWSVFFCTVFFNLELSDIFSRLDWGIMLREKIPAHHTRGHMIYPLNLLVVMLTLVFWSG